MAPASLISTGRDFRGLVESLDRMLVGVLIEFSPADEQWLTVAQYQYLGRARQPVEHVQALSDQGRRRAQAGRPTVANAGARSHILYR